MSYVNEQLLDALKQMVQVAKRHRPWSASVHQAEKTIAAAEQAQQAEPRCACGDSFTRDAVCANCLAAQPPAVAVPDEIGCDAAPWMSADTEPDIAYRDGWNACRAAMLAAEQKGGT